MFHRQTGTRHLGAPSVSRRHLERLRQGEAVPEAWLEREKARLSELWSEARKHFPGWVVGCDEVGRGPMAGPLVAAAAACREEVFLPGLNDSKKLTPEERESLADQILRSPIQIGLALISVDEISRGNLHRLSLQAMHRAVKELHVRPRFTLIDGRYPLPELKTPQLAVVGGDRRHALIAAASIVAKVTRDRLMRELAETFPGYGWERNVGYPTAEHQEALLRLGVTPHHRRNYRPVKALLPRQLLLEESSPS